MDMIISVTIITILLCALSYMVWTLIREDKDKLHKGCMIAVWMLVNALIVMGIVGVVNSIINYMN